MVLESKGEIEVGCVEPESTSEEIGRTEVREYIHPRRTTKEIDMEACY